MNKAINFINEKFEEFEKDLKKKEEEIKLLKKENSYLNKRLNEMDAVVDRQIFTAQLPFNIWNSGVDSRRYG